jgi:PTS system mannose-specific IIB component
VTIAIVIGTHGWAAEQLLKTAEMLLGEQENVGWIDFVPGENAETLIEKYNAQLAKLDTSKGVLFLVDTWEAARLTLQAALSSIKSITKLSPV